MRSCWRDQHDTGAERSGTNSSTSLRKPVVPWKVDKEAIMKKAVAAMIAAFTCAAMFAGCSDSDDQSATEAAASTAVPAEVSQLIDDWQAALDRGDESVLELYTPTGYHLYRTTKYSGDEMVAHLSGGDPEDHVWATEPVLILHEGDRYIVTGAFSNNLGGTWWTSALTFEIVDRPDGLRIASTNWLDAALSNHSDPSTLSTG